MSMVDLDDKLYEQIKEIIEKNSIDFPSIKNFVEKAVRNEIMKQRKKEE